jgi:ABC-type antimicrobial peptide transport system permease subunit
MDSIADDELADRAQVLRLLGSFAGLALLLAALGIYGVLSYLVSQRRREIGLRMAVGASRSRVVQSMMLYSVRLTATGLVIGLILAISATRLLSTLLYGVSPLDLTAFAMVIALLILTALLASYVPALRAAAVDPATILREE